MRLTFLGTRANIPIRAPGHFRHSSLLVETPVARLMVDCGADWLGRHPPGLDAILLTHAHPDHAGGLRDGASCPVFGTPEVWAHLPRRTPVDRRRLAPREPINFDGLEVVAIPVQHSLRAPAVALRISTAAATITYAPDVLALPDGEAALRGTTLYIGDGSSPRRPIVRGQGPSAVGHASIAEQLRWCEVFGVRRAIFTHCGQALLRLAPGEADALVRRLGEACGVAASVAVDGQTLEPGYGF